jgi:hypothetical protein
MQSAIAEFDHEMRFLLGSPELSPSNRRGVLVLWFEVTMSMLLVRRGDRDGANAFLYEWASQAGRLVTVKPDIDAVEQHLVTSTAVLATLHPELLTELHEILETFYGGSIDESRLLSAILPLCGVPFGLLQHPDGNTSEESLRQVLGSTTLRQELMTVIEATRRGDSFNTRSPVFSGEAGNIICRQLLSVSGTGRFKEQIGDGTFCAHCFTILPAIMASHLSSRRIAWHCGWFTVRTKR